MAAGMQSQNVISIIIIDTFKNNTQWIHNNTQIPKSMCELTCMLYMLGVIEICMKQWILSINFT